MSDASPTALHLPAPTAALRAAAFPIALVLALLVSPALAQAGDAAAGKAVFEDRCTLCHGADGHGQGPNLAGVVGRRAGSAPGFPFSAALKASVLIWTPANLERFLAGPGKFVPGTAMSVTLSDPAQRRAIIAYLASVKQ